MLDSEEFKDKYGAIIKVVSYLSDYHKSKRKEVIARIKKTKNKLIKFFNITGIET